MTEVLKNLANTIIAYCKTKNGIHLSINELKRNIQDVDKGFTNENIQYVTEFLSKKGLLHETPMTNTGGISYTPAKYSLSPSGWAYESYDKLLEDEQKAKDKKDKKDDIDLKNAERVYKSYPTTRLLAWIGAIAGGLAVLLKIIELLGWLPSKS